MRLDGRQWQRIGLAHQPEDPIQKHKHRWNETDLRVKKRSFWKEKMETGHGSGEEKRDSETNDAIYISTSISVFISTIPKEVKEQ